MGATGMMPGMMVPEIISDQELKLRARRRALVNKLVDVRRTYHALRSQGETYGCPEKVREAWDEIQRLEKEWEELDRSAAEPTEETEVSPS